MTSYLAPGHPAALFAALAEHIGADLQFVVGRSGPDPLDDPFVAGTTDLGWVCSTSFVELTTDRPASVREVGVAWVPDDPDVADRPVYFSDVVVSADSDVQSLADLAGRRIGCNDPASLSGYHALRIELGRRGHIAAEFASVVMTGGHHHSLARLLSDEVEAAVVDSIVRTRRTRESPEIAGLRVVERLGPWPTQPVVMRIDAADAEVDAVRAALLSANEVPEIREMLNASALTRLAATPDDHCSAIRAAMASLTDTSTR